MVAVPDDVWDAEKNYSNTHPNLRQTGNPPSQACITIKVIYTSGWVQSAGGGNSATAQQRALDVIAEAQNIYNTKYSSSNRLQTAITFNLVGGKTLRYLCPKNLRKVQHIISVLNNYFYNRSCI